MDIGLQKALLAHLEVSVPPLAPDCECEIAFESGGKPLYLVALTLAKVGQVDMPVLFFSTEKPFEPIDYPGPFNKALWLRKVALPDGREFIWAMELEVVCQKDVLPNIHRLMIRKNATMFLEETPFSAVFQ
jgi:hypothetical protein